MINRIVEIYRGSEVFGKIEVFSNAITWSATAISGTAESLLDTFSDDAFDEIASGKREVADRGFTLKVTS